MQYRVALVICDDTEWSNLTKLSMVKFDQNAESNKYNRELYTFILWHISGSTKQERAQ